MRRSSPGGGQGSHRRRMGVHEGCGSTMCEGWAVAAMTFLRVEPPAPAGMTPVGDTPIVGAIATTQGRR